MTRKKVLVCPLNWGLGHATRDIPIIREFLSQGFEVIIAVRGSSYDLLKSELPDLKIIYLDGYSVQYSRFSSQVLAILLLIPKILFWTYKEHRLIERIIDQENIDIVISDNRFGLWSRKAYSIFMTHQLYVKFPGILKCLEFVYPMMLKNSIKRFNEIWVPDFSGKFNLSGELSHNKRLNNMFYIGPLSRFIKNKPEIIKDIDVLFLLSGPEPQRSIFEEAVYRRTKDSKLKMVIVRGTKLLTNKTFNFPVYDMLNTKELGNLIQRTHLVVCRSGYSTVMDLMALKQTAVLVPTPGQTEQEYLARYLHKKGMFYSMSQNLFDINVALKNAIEFPENDIEKTDVLKQRIMSLKNQDN